MKKQIKTVIGWINKEDFDSYENRFIRCGINYIDLFKRSPITFRRKNKSKKISYKKVKVTIEDLTKEKR